MKYRTCTNQQAWEASVIGSLQTLVLGSEACQLVQRAPLHMHCTQMWKWNGTRRQTMNIVQPTYRHQFVFGDSVARCTATTYKVHNWMVYDYGCNVRYSFDWYTCKLSRVYSTWAQCLYYICIWMTENLHILYEYHQILKFNPALYELTHIIFFMIINQKLKLKKSKYFAMRAIFVERCGTKSNWNCSQHYGTNPGIELRQRLKIVLLPVLQVDQVKAGFGITLNWKKINFFFKTAFFFHLYIIILRLQWQ